MKRTHVHRMVAVALGLMVVGLVLGSVAAVAQPQTGSGGPTHLLNQQGADHGKTTEVPEQFQPVDVVVLPRGSGPGELGILEGPHGEPAIGPSSINIADDGHILVLDSVNHRVLTLSEDGTIQREIQFDRDAWGIDLAVGVRSNLYILDARGNRLLAYRPDGQPLKPALALSGHFQPNHVRIGANGQLEIEGWLIEFRHYKVGLGFRC